MPSQDFYDPCLTPSSHAESRSRQCAWCQKRGPCKCCQVAKDTPHVIMWLTFNVIRTDSIHHISSYYDGANPTVTTPTSFNEIHMQQPNKGRKGEEVDTTSDIHLPVLGFAHRRHPELSLVAMVHRPIWRVGFQSSRYMVTGSKRKIRTLQPANLRLKPLESVKNCAYNDYIM